MRTLLPAFHRRFLALARRHVDHLRPLLPARKILRAIRRRKKVYNFPWQTTLLMKATRWLPDWLVARIVGKHTQDRPMPSA